MFTFKKFLGTKKWSFDKPAEFAFHETPQTYKNMFPFKKNISSKSSPARDNRLRFCYFCFYIWSQVHKIRLKFHLIEISHPFKKFIFCQIASGHLENNFENRADFSLTETQKISTRSQKLNMNFFSFSYPKLEYNFNNDADNFFHQKSDEFSLRVRKH